MKKQLFFVGFFACIAAELVALIVFAAYTPAEGQSAVAVNEVVKTVTRDFDDMDGHKKVSSLDYAVLGSDGEVLYRTRSGLSESIDDAISHRDTVLDVVKDDETVGKIIIYNDGAEALQSQKRITVIAVAAAIALQCAVCGAYAAYLYRAVAKPFGKLKGFAERIAGGNLDIPLEMDRDNLFGAFTESFDIMRSELKKARLSEAEAQKSKKELVAKLSHDIKTPVASIKAVSEVGLAVAKSKKDRDNYSRIIDKTDSINSLVTNLFTATLEDLQQLSVSPENMESVEMTRMLENADYLCRAKIPPMPQCMVYADRLRLQQVFDNIFANSYKYADTDIAVTVMLGANGVDIAIEDFGGGVPSAELPALKEKFKRGENAKAKDGAGLGLYISDYFMREMNGNLDVQNGSNGLRVTVSVSFARIN